MSADDEYQHPYIYRTDLIRLLESSDLSLADNYAVDENKDGIVDYTFSDPNFNFVQFRSNLVAHWEYKPGSEVYLVWSQGNTPNVENYQSTGIGQSLFDNAFISGGRNIFLIKATYRLVR